MNELAVKINSQINCLKLIAEGIRLTRYADETNLESHFRPEAAAARNFYCDHLVQVIQCLQSILEEVK